MADSTFVIRKSMFRWSVTPVSIPVRIVFITILVCGCLVFWHWKAGIISNLSVQKYIPPFNSLASLLTTNYKVSVLKGSSYQNLFDDMDSHNPLFFQIWQQKMSSHQEDSLVANKDHGVSQLLSDPGFTHFDNYFAIKTYPEYINCKIMDIPRDLDPQR